MKRGFDYRIEPINGFEGLYSATSTVKTMGSAATFKTAKAALKDAKASKVELIDSVRKNSGKEPLQARITVENEDGETVLIYETYGTSWVKRQNRITFC